jgi:hypothetical protein
MSDLETGKVCPGTDSLIPAQNARKPPPSNAGIDCAFMLAPHSPLRKTMWLL